MSYLPFYCFSKFYSNVDSGLGLMGIPLKNKTHLSIYLQGDVEKIE